ncbi:hypothetical protein J5I95_03600 [Candidatus Poribacteria bacterium]|nr:hypothetical protein [Candidatus Poribacteria bacterium]
MLKAYQHFRNLFFIVFFSFLLAFIGCGAPSNHINPYYPPGLPKHQESDVEIHTPINYRIILIGDAGDPDKDEPVLKTLSEWAKKHAEKTSIVFLGDNMYDQGLTQKARHEADAKLGPQLAVVETSQAHGLFIPGNHDWEDSGKDGQITLMAQEEFIKKRLGTQSQRGHPVFLPECGKPGPRMLELPTSAPVVRLIVLDTQWWLHKHQKPRKDPETVIADLKNQLMTELPAIVVGHHPVESYGKHGTSKWSLFNRQDLNGKHYKSMIKELKKAFWVSEAGKTPLLIYAAGHDHSLQVLRGLITDYLLVSGAGSKKKLSAVGKGNNTLFAHEHTGFMVIDFLENGKVLLRVVEPADKEVVFHHWLKQ